MTAGSHAPRTFGVEEEYLLLDAEDGRPVDRAAELIYAMPDLDDQIDREYFSSQLETATPICRTADEAEHALVSFRKRAAFTALGREVVVSGSGLPPIGGEEAGTVTPNPRYRAIAASMRGVAENQYVTGTHVHVAVPSRSVGVAVIDHLARWAPVFLAMTVNSPIWCGEETGFASWRHIMGLCWPTNGYPLGFDRDSDYERSVDQLVSSRILTDPGLVTWVVRLSDTYPTLELRIADAQLDASAAVSYATIVRAIVERAVIEVHRGTPRPQYSHGIVDGAIWLAARNGLSTYLVDPLTGESMPACDLIARMIDEIEPVLDTFGDRERVERYVRHLREHGDPASRQSAVFAERGVDGLLALYRDSSLGSVGV